MEQQRWAFLSPISFFPFYFNLAKSSSQTQDGLVEFSVDDLNKNLGALPLSSSRPSTCVGTEWMVDVDQCSPGPLRRIDVVKAICEQILFDLSLCTILDPVFYSFPGEGGITGYCLLSESHLAIHTYPEVGVFTLNLYCCNQRKEYNWQSLLTKHLGRCSVTVKRISRGSPST